VVTWSAAIFAIGARTLLLLLPSGTPELEPDAPANINAAEPVAVGA
jgi:hypothetical protein